jgi:dTDP-4-dehydrorhamnose 3,5-epimerase
MRLAITPTPIEGVVLVDRVRSADARGEFERIFCADELRAAGWTAPVAQVNRSLTTRRGTVRGLHFQRAPHADRKLVTCVRGEVWDVALDLRQGSASFLRWHAQVLSGANRKAMLIPPGCAHGFQALSDDAELVYCHDAPYEAAAEGGVHPLDPRAAIAWPMPVTLLSDRDAGFARLTDDFAGVAA